MAQKESHNVQQVLRGSIEETQEAAFKSMVDVLEDFAERYRNRMG
jgi:hypothetical protein